MTESLWLQLGVAGAAILAMVVLVKAVLARARSTGRDMAEMQKQYVASLKADPSGRYLYYVPGAHGGSDKDGSAVVQYDLRTGKKKVLCRLHPLFEQKFGFVPKGTYAVAVDEAGERLFITWNVSRGSKAWDCCGLTVIHIPASERPL